MRFGIKSSSLKHNGKNYIGWGYFFYVFMGLSLFFFVREHNLKLWISIKDNQANFVLNEGFKIWNRERYLPGLWSQPRVISEQIWCAVESTNWLIAIWLWRNLCPLCVRYTKKLPNISVLTRTIKESDWSKATYIKALCTIFLVAKYVYPFVSFS